MAVDRHWNADPAELVALEHDLAELVHGRRPPWQSRAACRGMDPSVFVIAHGGNGDRARAVCADCPVVGECAAYGEATGSPGVWGGVLRGSRARRASAA